MVGSGGTVWFLRGSGERLNAASGHFVIVSGCIHEDFWKHLDGVGLVKSVLNSRGKLSLERLKHYEDIHLYLGLIVYAWHDCHYNIGQSEAQMDDSSEPN